MRGQHARAEELYRWALEDEPGTNPTTSLLPTHTRLLPPMHTARVTESSSDPVLSFKMAGVRSRDREGQPGVASVQQAGARGGGRARSRDLCPMRVLRGVRYWRSVWCYGHVRLVRRVGY
eukprot:1287887-Rhodomonas_salina.1